MAFVFTIFFFHFSSFLKLTDNGCEFIANLNGHEASVKAMAWDPSRKYLFSASFDKKVIVWDIGIKLKFYNNIIIYIPGLDSYQKFNKITQNAELLSEIFLSERFFGPRFLQEP
jgi:WD40 repeat protein